MESGETSSWTPIKISRSRVRAADSDTSVDNISLDDCLSLNYQPVGRGVRHGASRRTRFRNPLDFKWISDFRMDFWISKWISDFRMDFWISKWISGFQSGFLDFKVDFWISKRISKRISGFQSGFLEGFLDFKVDFSRDFWISSGFLDFKVDFSRDFWI